MGRPRKDQTHRLPTYHAARQCWRLRIHHHHGEKTFEWPAPPSTEPPPRIMATAGANQRDGHLVLRTNPAARIQFRLEHARYIRRALGR